jgi:arylamine N-acetyltransferase
MAFPLKVTSLLEGLSRIPYENLTKIVDFTRCNSLAHAALDTPDKLYRKSEELGAGGTCFSLTYYLRDMMLQKGFTTRFLMGDKYRFRNIHCGLLFAWEGEQYLLDPGYMIYQPLRLPAAGLKLHFPLIPNAVSLEDHAAENVWRLFSGRGKKLKFRFDFRKEPVTDAEFVQYWKDTFYFQMMEYPVLNMVRNSTQYYLQKRTFLTRTAEGSQVRELNKAQFEEVAVDLFGISRQVVDQSLEIILGKRKGLFLSD